MNYLLNFWRCWGKKHEWRYDGETLGGDWVRCNNCGRLDEYLPGVHMPHDLDEHTYLNLKFENNFGNKLK